MKNDNICKVALEYWYEQGLTWKQVEDKLEIKNSFNYRQKHNIKSRSQSDAVKLGHANMSEETKKLKSQKMSENQWLKRITPEQEAIRNKKWHETYNKNRAKNVEANRQAQLKRFSDPDAHKEFARKQKETKLKNGSDLGFGNWHKYSTYEQRSVVAKKSAETRRKNGYVQPKWPEDKKAERLAKQHESKIKNGTLYTSHGANSKPNLEFKSLLENAGIKYDQEHLIDTKYFDFKIGNTLIEINPSVTHNSTFSVFGHNPLTENYHKDKSQLAINNGYRCIHIWDWDDKEKILAMLSPKNSVYARKCIIKLVDNNESKTFINQYHLQGYSKSSINIGLYYNNELISIMTFGKPRYNKNYEYELIRYCYSYHVIGGAEKLFKYFINNYTPKSIISYCDLSKFTGELYVKLGFKLKTTNIKPSKHWYNMKTKKHITDNLLRARGYDQLFNANYGKGTSNSELMLKHNFVEIFDSGQATYIFNNE